MIKFIRRKGISVVVMIAFLAMVCYPYPGHTNPDQVVNNEKQERVKVAEAETGAEGAAEISEYYSRDDANVIEAEGYTGKKKKKFPWLLVVGGVVVVGVALYFLVVKKPKYDLTVNVGEGIDGTPTSGTTSYKKGASVSYNYSLKTGYTGLSVKFDGATVSASGTIKMEKNSTLSATCTKQGSLRITSTPQSATIYLNGQNKGKTNRTIDNLDPGTYTIKLTKTGYEDYETTETVTSGQQTTVTATMIKFLNGSYSGTTNQNYPVSMTVKKVSWKSTLTNYQIKVKSRVNAYGYIVTITITGVTSKTITDYYFSLTGTYLDLTGNFTVNGTTKVAGTWSLHYNSYIYGTFYGDGTYNASQTGSAPPAAAYPNLKPGEVNISAEISKNGKVVKRINQ
jgi:hypothetical protein